MNILRLLPPPTIVRNPYLKWAFFFCLSFVVLLWLSPDSYLAHLCAWREDSAWFFTAGKAWMEGMTPYVDFADSKGPLLWLIYGIGYLITPTSYIGVFWISVLAYTFTFVFLWRTAHLFVGQRAALLVLAVMPLLLFFRNYHNEIRAEDFCMTFICIGIYCTCRILKDAITQSIIRRYAFVLGMAMACVLLIKWNVFFMMGGMALVVVVVSFQHKSFDGLLFGIAGIAVIALPFIVYFLYKGCLGAFIHEYFVTTFLITGNGMNNGRWRTLAYNFLTDRYFLYGVIELMVVFVGIILFCRRFHMSYWLVLTFVPVAWFLVFQPTWYYYFITMMPFFLFLLLFVADCFSFVIVRTPLMVVEIVALVIYCCTICYNATSQKLIFSPAPEQAEWDAIQSVLTKKQKPRILCVVSDFGQGVISRALPACKYWALQNGSGDDIKAERQQAIRERKADFVLVNNKNPERLEPYIFTILQQSGYHQCVVQVVENGKTVMKALPVYAKE